MLLLAFASLLLQLSAPNHGWSASIDPATAGADGVRWTITASAPYCGGYQLGDGVYIRLESPLALPEAVDGDGVLLAGEPADVRLQDGALRVLPSSTGLRSMVCRQGDVPLTVELLPSVGLSNPEAGDYFIDVWVGSDGAPVRLPVTIAAVDPGVDPQPDPLPSGDAAILAGQVVIGPVCPVVRADDSGACADRPFAATLLIQSEQGQQRFVQTDSQGVFTIQLDPGRYQVLPQTPTGQILPRGIPQTVTLGSGDQRFLTVSYDSGIR